jgi:hypothetical protein
MAFLNLKYTDVGKIEYERQTNPDLGQKHCFFPCKFVDLRFADWHTSEICGFAIAELAHEFCGFAICGP